MIKEFRQGVLLLTHFILETPKEVLAKHAVVVVDLLFYVHGKHLRSCRDGQLT